MTDRSGRWTRRQFSQALAATAASSLLLRTAPASMPARHEGFAFVGSSASDPMSGTVQVYRVSHGAWREVHAVQTASPAHLVMHPTMPVLYVVHDVAQWEHRPRGAVSAYGFDTTTGHLTHAATQPLSLSATNPRHAVIAAGGQALFVSAESGGIYNALPIAGDGTLHPVSAISKEFGMQNGDSRKTAAPGQLVLHPDGSVFAADPGQEIITRFAVSRRGITAQHRTRVHVGAGASQLALLGLASACALNADDGSISLHNISAEGLSPAIQTCRGTGRTASLQVHPEGQFLAVSSDDSLQVLQMHPHTGRLLQLQTLRQARLLQMQFAAGGSQLTGLHSESSEVVMHAFNERTGKLASPCVVAKVDGATSLLLQLA